MMKFQYVTNLAIATVLVVPAVTLQGGGTRTLEQALDQTLFALENLAGIEQRLARQEPEAVGEILTWTEAPLVAPAEDPGAPDRRLEVLRGEVGELQSRLERARATMAAGGATAGPYGAPIVTGPPSGPTVGLNDALRDLLQKPARLAPSGSGGTPSNAAAAATIQVPEAPVVAEAEGFTADVLRLGRALYRQARYVEAAEVLAREPDSHEAAYWRARSLEKAGEATKAIAAYQALIDTEGADYQAARAREDLDFLQWRLAFEKKTVGTSKEQPR